MRIVEHKFLFPIVFYDIFFGVLCLITSWLGFLITDIQVFGMERSTDLIVSFVFLISGVLHWIAAFQLLRLRGRMLQIVLAAGMVVSAVLMLMLASSGIGLQDGLKMVSTIGFFCIPAGLLFGPWFLWYLKQPDVKAAFNGVHTSEMRPGTKSYKSIFCVGVFTAVILLLVIWYVYAEVLSARQNSLRASTLQDMRSIADALNQYALDHDQFPAVETMNELAKSLEPQYIKSLPSEDGWGSPFRYICWKTDPEEPGCDQYLLMSAGKDKNWEHSDVQAYKQSKIVSDDIAYSSSLSLQPL